MGFGGRTGCSEPRIRCPPIPYMLGGRSWPLGPVCTRARCQFWRFRRTAKGWTGTAQAYHLGRDRKTRTPYLRLSSRVYPARPGRRAQMVTDNRCETWPSKVDGDSADDRVSSELGRERGHYIQHRAVIHPLPLTSPFERNKNGFERLLGWVIGFDIRRETSLLHLRTPAQLSPPTNHYRPLPRGPALAQEPRSAYKTWNGTPPLPREIKDGSLSRDSITTAGRAG